MNQNPYRKTPVTAKQLLGEDEPRSSGAGLDLIRLHLNAAAAMKKKEAGNG